MEALAKVDQAAKQKNNPNKDLRRTIKEAFDIGIKLTLAAPGLEIST